ncbi:MAG: hypothetical protein LBD47_01275, partial [Treponema sp.]|nr:hypothetical protein [Treponema sp.]
DIPDKRLIRLIPPYPTAFASADKYRRLWYSFSVGSTVSIFLKDCKKSHKRNRLLGLAPG